LRTNCGLLALLVRTQAATVIFPLFAGNAMVGS